MKTGDGQDLAERGGGGAVQRYQIKILKIASGPITPPTKNSRLGVIGVAKCWKKRSTNFIHKYYNTTFIDVSLMRDALAMKGSEVNP